MLWTPAGGRPSPGGLPGGGHARTSQIGRAFPLSRRMSSTMTGARDPPCGRVPCPSPDHHSTAAPVRGRRVPSRRPAPSPFQVTHGPTPSHQQNRHGRCGWRGSGASPGARGRATVHHGDAPGPLPVHRTRLHPRLPTRIPRVHRPPPGRACGPQNRHRPGRWCGPTPPGPPLQGKATVHQTGAIRSPQGGPPAKASGAPRATHHHAPRSHVPARPPRVCTNNACGRGET